MEKCLKFKYIEKNLLKLLSLILDSQPILKYIFYLNNDPQSQPNVTENLLETGHIILTPFNSTILSEQKVCMFINPYSGNLEKQPLSNLVYLIDIVIPSSKWLLSGLGEIRAFRISDEISKLIDKQRVMGITETEITQFKIYKVGDSYSGLSLWIRVNSSTMKGLR